MERLEQITNFKRSLIKASPAYGVQISENVKAQLVSYYELLLRWNERLHLVAPCTPEEFATRHVLESLILVNRFTQGARIADVGSGAGLPIIPCLIVRNDIEATLIESSQKKSVFLREALKMIGTLKRARIVAKPFEEIQAPDAEFVTCRALDDFSRKITTLIKWAPTASRLLLFGGEDLGRHLSLLGVHKSETLLPNSDRRFLFELTNPN